MDPNAHAAGKAGTIKIYLFQTKPQVIEMYRQAVVVTNNQSNAANNKAQANPESRQGSENRETN